MAIEVGNVFEGRVTGVKPFGAFVALPEGRVGMVHISEVSNEYVQDINTVLHDGDTVKVQVIQVAPDGKIALSIERRCRARPARTAAPAPAARAAVPRVRADISAVPAAADTPRVRVAEARPARPRPASGSPRRPLGATT